MTAETAMRWRAVAVDGAVFDDLSAQGFGGVEECTEYDFSDGFSLKRKREPKGAPKAKKRKQAGSGQTMKPSKTGCSLESNAEDAPDANDGLEEVLAWSHFGLPSPLLRALAARGFAEPTQIQALTLPAAILGRRDILGAAETGSGKTLAFGLPLLAGILEEKSRKSEDEKSKAEGDRATRPLYALILTPTRELAVQVKNHLVDAARFTDIKIAVVVGGMAAVKQERILRGQPEVVVATPGRLWELVQQGNPHLSRIAHIRYLVIDETDRMLERGHFEELHSLLEKLNDDEEARRRRQNFVFSATLTLVHEPPKYVRRGGGGRRAVSAAQTPEQKLRRIVEALGIADPKVVDVTGGGRAGSGSGTSGTLTECRITCAFDDKDHYVYYFAQRHPGRTIVFCNSIGCVRRLAHLLRLLECRALPLHSAMQQKQRLKNLERFRDDDLGILVATDVAARGLDIPSVDHVLHYQTPRTTESYVHRSGRTARAHKQGITVLLMEPTEIQSYIKLCNTLGRSEDLPLFPVQENYLNAVKQRVNLARDLDRLQLSVQKTTSETGWIQKAAEEMDIIVDDFARKFDDDAVSPNKKLATLKQKQLATLLAKPIFPKNFSGKYPLTNDLDLEEVMGNRTPGKAVEVMKAALEERQQKKKKTKAIPLFKPRNKKNNDGSEQEQRRADLGAAVKRLRRAEMGRKGGKKRVGKKRRK